MNMTKINKKPVVLGLGNPLFTDEGVGIRVLHQLMADDLSGKAELVDGGTDGLMLLNVVEAAEHLIVIDAINGGLPAGSVQKYEMADLPVLISQKLSPHQLGFQEVLALAGLRKKLPNRLILFGVEPASLEWGTQLSPTVEAVVPMLIDLVENQIDELICKVGGEG